MFDIITVGSATRDVFLFTEALHTHKAKDAPTHVEACLPFGSKINIDQIHYDTGGGGTNNAVTFARLGELKVAALVRIGADSRGRSVLNALNTDQIDTSLVQITPNEYTAYSAILSPAHNSGERTILTYRGASTQIEHEKIPWNKLKAQWFHLSSLGGDMLLLDKILTHAKKIRAAVAFNPGGKELDKMKVRLRKYTHLLKSRVSFLVLNREEAHNLTRKPLGDTKALLRALAQFAPISAMTDGPKGAYAVYAKKAYFVPSVGHKPENLTGAGDAFGAGFVTGWVKSRGDIKYALRLASFNADSVVQKVGAKNGILEKIPSKQKMEKLPVQNIKI